MELSAQTLAVLKNAAAINTKMIFSAGSKLMVAAPGRNLVLRANIVEDLPQAFGIYNLPEFLSVIALVDQPQLSFNGTHVLVSDAAGTTSIKYFFSDMDHMGDKPPANGVVMPSVDVTFDLPNTTIANVKRAASALGHTELVITGDGGLHIEVAERDNSTSNRFKIAVAGKTALSALDFVISIETMKMLPADYLVEICAKAKIAQFTSTTLDQPVTYWVAMEKSSTFTS